MPTERVGTVEVSQIKSPAPDNPIVSRTPNLDGGETIKYQSGDVLVKDANGDVVSETPPAPSAQQPVEAPVNPNQNLLDTMWQDYMTGLRSTPEAKGTNFSMGNFNAPTDTVGGAGGTDGTGTTTGPGNGAGAGNTAGTGTSTGTGGGGTGTVTGGPGTTVSGNIKKVTQLPGTIKQTTSTTSTPITGTIPSIFGATDIKDLTPGLTKGSAFKFANEPTFSEQVTPVPQTQPYDYSGQILNAATGGSTNTANTIEDLKAGLVKGTPFSLANQPKFISALTQVPTQNPTDYTQQILNAAQGGLIQGYAAGDSVENPYEIPMLSGKTWRGRQLGNVPHFQGAQFPGYEPKRYADGGDVEEHNPQFFSVGGLNSMENTYVQGEGDGTSDSVPAMLADGEFVIPADVVSKLGNGSNNAGAKVLDGFLSSIRSHAQDHDPKKLPPESKGPLAYLLDAKRKVG